MDIQIYLPELNIILQNFKKKGYEIQDSEDYQPYRVYLKEELAVTTMDTRTTNQLNLGLNLKSISTTQY